MAVLHFSNEPIKCMKYSFTVSELEYKKCAAVVFEINVGR